MLRSPYDRCTFELRVWRIYALFDLDTKSELKKTLFRIYAVLYRIIFCYIGFMLQFGSVFYAQSSKEAAQTLYVSTSFGNAVMKLTLISRDNMRKLYDKINCEKFRSNGTDEQK